MINLYLFASGLDICSELNLKDTKENEMFLKHDVIMNLKGNKITSPLAILSPSMKYKINSAIKY